MRHLDALETRSMRRIRPIVGVLAVAVVLTVSLAQSAYAQIAPPPVPAEIEAPEGTEAFLVGQAVGTQNYICLPSGSKFAWSLFTPQATLFNDDGKQLTTHFFSPNPFEGGTVRPAWQHSRDTSTVWVRLVRPSSDPDFVAPGAIPWFLLEVVGALAGPDAGDELTATTYIQRVNTGGGVAPSSGCSGRAHVGNKAFVPYTADYVFYRDTAGE